MKTLQLILLATIAFANAHAQKLPNVQQASLRSPANVKIDGKVTEWGDSFQAYNPASRMYYTLCNDKVNLYLVARMDGLRGADKAIKAGITLTFDAKPEGKSKGNAKVAITFPADERGPNKDAISDLIYTADKYKREGKNADSVKLVANKKINASFKQIDVSGIKDVNDASIPVYNSQGILAAAQLDDKIDYVYELALPLKYLDYAIDSNGKIKYNIKINGTARNVIINTAKLYEMLPAKDVNESLYGAYPTDFSGEYTLAK